MRNPLITWSVRGLLALVALSLAASAQASTIYNFTFTSTITGSVFATGSFTTSHANVVVPGYEMIESIIVNSIVDSTKRIWGPFVSSHLRFEPSDNPITQTFINFDMTGTQPVVGEVDFAFSPAGADLVLDTTSFDISSHHFSAFLRDRSVPVPYSLTVVDSGARGANLVITAAAVPAPEPTTLVLLGTGPLGALVSPGCACAS